MAADHSAADGGAGADAGAAHAHAHGPGHGTELPADPAAIREALATGIQQVTQQLDYLARLASRLPRHDGRTNKNAAKLWKRGGARMKAAVHTGFFDHASASAPESESSAGEVDGVTAVAGGDGAGGQGESNGAAAAAQVEQTQALKKAWRRMEEEVARATQELPWAGMHDDMTQVIACHAALAQEQAKAAWCEQAKEQAREIETSLLGQRAQAAEAFEATGSQHAAALTLRYDAAVKALRDTHQELRGYQLGHDRDVSAMGILLEDYKVGTKPRIMPLIKAHQARLDRAFASLVSRAAGTENVGAQTLIVASAKRIQQTIDHNGRNSCRQRINRRLGAQTVAYMHELRREAAATRERLADLLLFKLALCREHCESGDEDDRDSAGPEHPPGHGALPGATAPAAAGAGTSAGLSGATPKTSGNAGMEDRWNKELREERTKMLGKQLDLQPGKALLSHAAQTFEYGSFRLHVPSIKSAPRTIDKVFEKYSGDFSCVCDFVRASLVVGSFAELFLLLRELEGAAAENWIVFRRIKHRLSPRYSGAPTHGFRDILLNFHLPSVRQTEHVVELQLHVDSLHQLYTDEDQRLVRLARLMNFSTQHDIEAAFREAKSAATASDEPAGGDEDADSGENRGTVEGEGGARGGQGESELSSIVDRIRCGDAATREADLSSRSELGLSTMAMMKLCFALKQVDCVTQRLVLRSCGIGPEPARELGMAISESLSASIKELDLRDNNLGNDGAIALVPAVGALRVLDISSNDVGDAGKFAIAAAINSATEHTKAKRVAHGHGLSDSAVRGVIERLACDAFDVSNDTTTLRVEGTDTESLRPADGVLLGAVLASNGSIRDLALVNTGVGPSWRNDYDERGTSAVVAASVEHPTLSSLTLDGTKVSDDAAALLAKGLARARLRTLSVRSTELTDTAKRLLGRAMSDGCPLQHVRCDGWFTEPEMHDLQAPNEGLRAADAALLAGMLAHNQSRAALTLLQLSGNEFGAAGVQDLARALAPSGVTAVDLSDNELRDSGATAVAKGLANSSLRTLNLARNHVGERGAEALAAALRQASASSLTSLDISRNVIRWKGARSLAAVLDHSAIEELNLEGCHIGPDGAKYLAPVAGRSFHTLNLRGNDIGDVGKRLLARALLDCDGRLRSLHMDEWAVTPTTKELDLSMKQLGPADGMLLAAMLKHNHSLEKLDLSTNRLTAYGQANDAIDALAQALHAEGASLAELDLSANWIDGSAVDAVVELCCAPPLSRLDISKNHLGDAAEVVGDALRDLKRNTLVLSADTRQSAVADRIARLPRPLTITFARVRKPHVSTADLRHATMVSKINVLPSAALHSSASAVKDQLQAAVERDERAMQRYEFDVTHAISSGKDFRVRFAAGSLGLGFRQLEDGTFVVEDVVRGGQADALGVKIDDIIVAVNDVGLNSLNVADNDIDPLTVLDLKEVCDRAAVQLRA